MASRTELTYADEDRRFLQSYLPLTSASPEDETLPFVTLTFATSLDSSLSIAPGVQTALSGPKSKAMTHFLRSRHEAILVGVGTAIADNPSLNCRLEGLGGYGAEGLIGQPRPIVVDPRGRWQLDSETKILNLTREGRGRAPWIITTKQPAVEQARLLEEVGGSYIVLNSDAPDQRNLSWRDILRAIRSKGIKNIMIEGGGVVINTLLSAENAGLIGSVIVTIAPTWLGEGGVVISPPRAEGNKLPVARLKRTKWHQLGQDVVLCGELKQTGVQTKYDKQNS